MVCIAATAMASVSDQGLGMSQLADRFQSAIVDLVADGSVKARLARAWCRHLQDLEEDALPDDLRAGFAELRECLYQHRPIGAESAVEATVRKMSVREAENHAQSIITLLLRLTREPATGERLKVVSGGQAGAAAIQDPAPAFLAERSR